MNRLFAPAAIHEDMEEAYLLSLLPFVTTLTIVFLPGFAFKSFSKPCIYSLIFCIFSGRDSFNSGENVL
jgi:hypothetical protein